MPSSEEHEKVVSKMRGAINCVRYILHHYPEARNSDKLLLLIYWSLVDKIKIPKDFWREFLDKATSPETIIRARRKVQEGGEYLPSQEVLEKRRTLDEYFRRTKDEWDAFSS